MAKRQRGSTAVIKMSYEGDSAFDAVITAANRRPWVVPRTTFSPDDSDNLQKSAVIKDDLNPGEPFDGNRSGTINMGVPVDDIYFGRILNMALTYDAADRLEVFGAAGVRGNRMTGTPTIGVVNATAVATFSAGQSSAAVGDRIVYHKNGVYYTAYIKTNNGDGDAATWTVATTRVGSTAPADITGATVDAVHTNYANATPGTVDIASGVATFSNAPTTPAAGMRLIYGGTSVAYLVSGSGVTWTVEAANGFSPADVTGAAVEALEVRPIWDHYWSIHRNQALRSANIANDNPDVTGDSNYIYTGCKINSLAIPLGGDGEMIATATLTICGSEPTDSLYDASPSPTAVSVPSRKFSNVDSGITVSEGADVDNLVAATYFRTVNITLNRNIDEDDRVLGSGGRKVGADEGIVDVTADIEAGFRSENILAPGDNKTDRAFRYTNDRGGLGTRVFEITFPKYRQARSRPDIAGPDGVNVSFQIMPFRRDTDEDSAIIVRLRNDWPDYSFAAV